MGAPSSRGAARRLRIVAGRWRGRRFRVPILPRSAALRPTPDRVRETLFNWLRLRIVGAHCLDLYAGSGALGLEALSRGAASVVFVEAQHAAADALGRLLAEWDARDATLIEGQALPLLSGSTAARSARRARHAPRKLPVPPGGFGLAFLDPPFDATGELSAAISALASGWLASDARVYVEQRRGEPLPALPPGWRALRSGSAGEVRYHLLEATTESASPAGGRI